VKNTRLVMVGLVMGSVLLIPQVAFTQSEGVVSSKLNRCRSLLSAGMT